MKPLAQLREIPETRRYFCVTLGERGEHHLRMPRYDIAVRLFRSMASASKRIQGEGLELSSIAALYELMPTYGGFIGYFWNHRGFNLETAIPVAPTQEDLTEVGIAVADELQEAEYSASEIVELAVACMAATQDLLEITGAARSQANFTQEAPMAKMKKKALSKKKSSSKKRTPRKKKASRA